MFFWSHFHNFSKSHEHFANESLSHSVWESLFCFVFLHPTFDTEVNRTEMCVWDLIVFSVSSVCLVFWLKLHVRNSYTHSKTVDLNANFKETVFIVSHCMDSVRIQPRHRMHFTVLHFLSWICRFFHGLKTCCVSIGVCRSARSAFQKQKLSINRIDVRLAFSTLFGLHRSVVFFVFCCLFLSLLFIYRIDCHWSNLSTVLKVSGIQWTLYDRRKLTIACF